MLALTLSVALLVTLYSQAGVVETCDPPECPQLAHSAPDGSCATCPTIIGSPEAAPLPGGEAVDGTPAGDRSARLPGDIYISPDPPPPRLNL